jgi:hypothetical protein
MVEIGGGWGHGGAGGISAAASVSRASAMTGAVRIAFQWESTATRRKGRRWRVPK